MKNTVTLYRTVRTDDQQEAGPIRESLVLFISKIASVLIVTDLVYAVPTFLGVMPLSPFRLFLLLWDVVENI